MVSTDSNHMTDEVVYEILHCKLVFFFFFKPFHALSFGKKLPCRAHAKGVRIYVPFIKDIVST